MLDDSGQGHLGRRILIAVGAMLGASALFVGAVMLVLSVLVEHVVAPPSHEPTSVQPVEASPGSLGAPRARAASATDPVRPLELKTGDRS